uniref:Dehydrogenase n=1 Tax=Timema shepardi TaxID=629360 RepID=A0A7R9ATF0_TIMSH|nr:unnamed protein product [Timema shepardi]
MERWSGKVALVTGASVGIGAGIVQELVKHGLKVVGLARRVEKVEIIWFGEGIHNLVCIGGHYLPDIGPVTIYHATKHAVTVLTEGLRRELVQIGSKTKVTSISPGLVETEFSKNIRGPDGYKVYKENPVLQAKDIADAVVYTLGTPPHVQVANIIQIQISSLTTKRSKLRNTNNV